MLRFTIALIWLSPAIATAQCLTANSLDSGITVEYGNGNVAYLERDESGIQLDSYIDNGYAEEIILFRSYDGIFNAGQTVHTKNSWEALEKTSITYDFEMPDPTSLAEGDRGNGTRTLDDSVYGPRIGAFGWSVYASAPLVVGDCSYEAVRIFTHTISFRDGIFDLREVKYLPEPGIGLQVGNSGFGSGIVNAEIVSLIEN